MQTKLLFIVFFCSYSLGIGQTVGIFYDTNVPQISFAAADIQKALKAKGLTADPQPLSRLTTPYTNSKIVLCLHSNTVVKSTFTSQAGSVFTAPTEQGFALRTTAAPISYWVFGGDSRGTMYGGLQVAENISATGLSQTYNFQENPYLLNRGIKFNIPLDVRSPTYEEQFRGDGHKIAIQHVWDLSFWKEYLDEMARHRYNVLSLWHNHPFTSMVIVPGYEDVVIEDVQGWDSPTGTPKLIKKMTIQQKIVFWKEVMQYGVDRGFDIYWFTWNILPFGNNLAKYGILKDSKDLKTRTYYAQSTAAFLKEYPMIKGIGVTVGEAMKAFSAEEKEQWAWEAYGKPLFDYAKSIQGTPIDRELVFVHRQHQGSVSSIMQYFQVLDDLPNVRLDMSFKYSKARIHGSATSSHMNNFLPDFEKFGRKTWLEGRNDDFYFMHWADAEFVKGYYINLPDKNKYIQGPLYGSDGWVWTRDFTSKNNPDKDRLTVTNRWLMHKLWGRLGYNPETSQDVFVNQIAVRYPSVNAPVFYTAWNKASRAVQMSIEQVSGNGWELDFQFWPEGWNFLDGWKTFDITKAAQPFEGSKFCSFDGTAKKTCGTKISAWTTVRTMETLASEATAALNSTPRGTIPDLDLNIKNIYAQTRFALAAAKKYAAILHSLEGNTKGAQDSMARSYCYWKQYTNQMDELFIGVTNHRGTEMFPDWHAFDDEALGDLTRLKVAAPNCTDIVSMLDKQMQFSNFTGEVKLSVYNIRGKFLKTITLSTNPNSNQITKALHREALPHGMYLTRIKAQNRELSKHTIMLMD